MINVRGNMNPVIDRAVGQDLRQVLALLGEVDLPIEGVAAHFNRFWVARNGGEIVGCVGLERYGDRALLRSLAVSRGAWGRGLGKALTARLLDETRAAGVRDVVLLTTTAKDFFARHFAFSVIDRSLFDDTFAHSPEWHLPRCSSAVCMHLRLAGEGETREEEVLVTNP